jgi:DNA-binding CsgD family transcriptional regulator
MGKSERLRLADVRALYRLVGECRELGDDAEAWRRHLLAGVCRLTGAQLVIGGEARLVGPGRLMVPVHFAGHGWPSGASRSAFLAWLKDPTVLDNLAVRRFHQLPGNLVTRTRQQLISDAEYYASAFCHEAMKPAGLDHGLLSRYALPGRDKLHELVLNRTWGEPPFGRREWVLVHLLHQEIGPRVGRALATSEEPGPSGLSPRLRQTLEALLDGDSEKQAALRLGVSARTVHEYVVAVYRHFEVSSRGELIARFLRRFRGRPPVDREPEHTA